MDAVLADEIARRRSRRGSARRAALAVAAALALCAPGPARAADYEAEIEVESELDLHELHARGLISDETLEALLVLLQAGVDLGTASREELEALPGLTAAAVERILAHRRRAAAPRDPASLVDAGVLRAEDLHRLAPFLTEPAADPDRPAVSGRVQLRSRYTAGDPLAPPVLARGRAEGPRGLSAGFALVTTRLRLGPVRHDPAREALVAGPSGYRAHVPRLFARWQEGRLSVLAGSFRIGFAERLTLDNPRRPTPDGAYPDDLVLPPGDPTRLCRYASAGGGEPACAAEESSARHVTPDFRWSDGFRGVAGSLAGVSLGAGLRVGLHAFGSHQPRSVYQYEIYDRSACSDPREPTRACAAPPVFEGPAAARRLVHVTLPDVYDELAAGGRVALAVGDGLEVGVTGYRAAPRWRVPGAHLDFQEASRQPFGGPFGAVGASAAARAGGLAFFVEAARSFDRVPGGGGGLGVVQRLRHAGAWHETELALRRYGRDFANPYARPISAPDELEGLRARNEAGIRLRHFHAGTAWRIRATGDLWTLPADGRVPGTAGTLHLALLARADFVGLRRLAIAAWVDHANKDLRRNGPGACYDVVAREAGSDPAAPASGLCRGELHRITGRLTARPAGRLLVAALEYGHAFVTDARYPRSHRQDATVAGELTARPAAWVRGGLRARYLRRALDDDGYLERRLAASGDLTWAPSPRLVARLWYGLVGHLDRRPSTRARRPNPEHRLQLELESRF